MYSIVLALFLALQQTPPPPTADPQASATELPDVRVMGASPAPAQTTAQEDADEDRVVCRRERVVGSNRPQRVCMTRREWTRSSDSSREELRNMRGGAETLPGERGGGGL